MIWLFASAWYASRDETPRIWINQHYSAYWLANWSMFTNRGRNQRKLEVTFRRTEDGEWKRINMARWFPARWESGLRFERKEFMRSPARLRVLASALCARMDASDAVRMPMTVRFTEVSWRKTLGSHAQPKRRVRRQQRLEWDCADPPPSPPDGWRF